MSQARIVTDSTAELSPEIVEELDITVVPWRVDLGSESVADSPALRSTAFYKGMIKKRVLPVALPPSPRQFAQVYDKLARETDEIVSLHVSSRFANVVQTANRARIGLFGRCQVNVVDSQFISRAMGILVIEAAKAAQRGVSGADIVRLVHGLIPRTYFAFHVETMDYLKRSGLVPNARDTASGLARALLMIEDGSVVSLHRSRSRGTPIERLVEFITEFQSFDQLAILHTGLGPGFREIRSQLAGAMPGQRIEEHIYSPVLFTYVGPAALGVVVFEG